MASPSRPAANDARAASGPGMDATRDLFAELDAAPCAPEPAATPAPAAAVAAPLAADSAMPSQAHSTPTETDPPAPRIRYAEAQRLMAIGRAQGPDALTPEQHHAIWDCLLELPESQAWLAAQLTALQGELQERGLRPWKDHRSAR
ncbi:MAG: hypothetical protein RR100_15405 [Comamonas sp.]